MHHAITIRPREDPQFNYLPIWLIDKKELENEKVDGKGGEKSSRIFVRLPSDQQTNSLIAMLVAQDTK